MTLNYVVHSKTFKAILEQVDFQKIFVVSTLIVAFAAILPNYWIFLFFVFVVVYLVKDQIAENHGQIFLYYALLLIVPNFMQYVPGVGGIETIIPLTYARFLNIILLLPLLFLPLEREKKWGALGSDKLVLMYLLMTIILEFRDDNLTSNIRIAVVLLLDVYVAYYVLSRHIDSYEILKKSLSLFLYVVLGLSVIAVAELILRWHFYTPLSLNLGTINNLPLYLYRSGMLRASTTFFSPIELGIATSLAYGCYLALASDIKTGIHKKIIPVLLIIGLLSSLSRGPWVGFVIMLVVFALCQRDGLQKIIKYVFLISMTIPFMALTPFWDRFLGLLPFIGNVEVQNIEYRQRLIEQAWSVILRYPLFGSTNFLQEPEMLSMIQGQGIVDLVNTYLVIALESGLVTMGFFIAALLSLVLNTYRLSRYFIEKKPDFYRLGSALVGMMAGLMFTIATMSPIDYVPPLIWLLAGTMGAYILVARKMLIEKN